MGPMLIWPNITKVIHVLQEILALTSLGHIISSKRVIVQTINVVISNIQMQKTIKEIHIIFLLSRPCSSTIIILSGQ